ncbi:glycosyltransferase family 2 protein [Aestuariibius sp. 2305UL40-4]|uniref:glycosyltransferase family 2 protein n=1 Tax=Aestuariibius violaceus TaxID=3234132 RepID=UPI00345EEE20
MATIKDVLRGKTPVQMRLKGDLWQWRHSFDPPSGDPTTLFAIPLVSKRRSEDWGLVSQNLAATIASLRAQTSSRWQAVICGQDAPDGIAWDDQVRFLPFKGSDSFFDKGRKRRALIRNAARTRKDDGYLFQFDADDLLHPGVVAHIHQDDNGSGYYIDQGYMLEQPGAHFAPLDDAPKHIAFNQICGSSNAVRFDFRRHTGSKGPLGEMKSHRRIPERMRYFGYEMTPIPFPAALYLVGHGENMIARRGTLDSKLRYAQTHRITDADQIARIRAEFGLDKETRDA